MKKENKKLAQEKRASERRRQEQLAKLKKALAYGIPTLAAAALVIGIALNSGNSTEASDTSSSQSSSTAQTGTSYSIDTSLTIKEGDKINLDYVGTIDGVEFEGGNTYSSGTDLVIGSHTAIDDFEEQLIGRHPGDRVDVVVTFPEDYGDEKLNGKQALFECIINGIYR